MYIVLFLALITLPFLTNEEVIVRHQLVENPAQIIGDDYDNGYPESKYNFVLDKVLEIYGKRINKLGGKLYILRDFNDGAVNAWAWRIGHEYHLEIPGGMSKYKLINEEAFITTICHELGHLLGGAPYKGSQISVEGQSDYFATSHCMKRLLPKINAYKDNERDHEVVEMCKGDSNKSICERVLYGAKSLTSYIAEVQQKVAPSLNMEDSSQVNQTIFNHPSPQCRLDTLKRGFFCSDINEDDISQTDPNAGYCSSNRQDQYGRPNCWYFEEL